jgi:hypothetical protein
MRNKAMSNAPINPSAGLHRHLLLPLLLLLSLVLSGCQRSPTPDDEGQVLRTRVVDSSGRLASGVSAGYCAPGGTSFEDFELLSNSHGHWGSPPRVPPFPTGCVRFSSPQHKDAIYAWEQVPEVVRLVRKRP